MLSNGFFLDREGGALSLVMILSSLAAGQTVDQKTQGTCSPAVITNGNVVITCSAVVNPTELKKLQKGVDILNAILKENDAQMMSKLDAVLALLAPLKKEMALQRKELNDFQEYTEVSKLNIVGTTGNFFPPLVEETEISRILEGSFRIHDVDGVNHATTLCTAAAVEKYQTVIQSYPKFPFSYYSLAFCLKAQGDHLWTDYANKAMEILRITTKIGGHHSSHDLILRELEQVMQRKF
jgi:hypothetical protein